MTKVVYAVNHRLRRHSLNLRQLVFSNGETMVGFFSQSDEELLRQYRAASSATDNG